MGVDVGAQSETMLHMECASASIHVEYIHESKISDDVENIFNRVFVDEMLKRAEI